MKDKFRMTKTEAPSLNGFIKDLGYPCENHEYATKDGYINSIIRIPGTKEVGAEPHVAGGKPVVIYQHGLMDCCAGIIADGEDSLGFQLVNKGFDLWLPNSRGNRYSREHMKSDDVPYYNVSKDADYWEFSF